MKKVLKSVAAVIAVFAASVAAFAFSPTQTEAEVATEISNRVAGGEDLAKVAEAAFKDGVNVNTFVSAVVASGRTVDEAVASSVGGGYASADVVAAGVQKGGDQTALNQVALDNLPATGAGQTQGGDTAANTADTTGGTTGGTGGVNSGNRSAAIGSGSGSVSPS